MTYGPPKESPPSDDRPAKKEPKKEPKKYSWKSLIITAIILVIIWQVAHVVMQSRGKNAGAPPKTSVPPTSQKPTPVPTVTLGGHRVAAGGGPMVILNPGLVSPGGHVGVIGSGFAPRTSVVVWLRTGRHASSAKIVGHGRTSATGTVITGFSVPTGYTGSKATVVVQPAGGTAGTAQLSTPGGMGTATIAGKAVGKPGDHATVSATGFGPGEKINVYWGRVSGIPATTLTADSSGGVSSASVPVGIAPTGPTSLVLVGTRTHTTATVPFTMIGLYPSVYTHPWAMRAGKSVYFGGSGFAPNEQILIYLDAANGVPALTATADSGGKFKVSFVVPFGLKGKNTLTAVGEQSRASTSSGLDILPYSPSVQASTYDALPGTELSFYASGFAANEVVLVYAQHQLVTAFRVDAKGSAAAAGRYIVPSGGQGGLAFTLRGVKSGGIAVAKVKLTAPAQPVTIPPQPPYTLPPSLGGKPLPSHSPTSHPSSHPSP
jgi:hypothetical protein